MNLADINTQKKIQGGDIREFEKLFARFYAPLCHHSFSILKDMDLAEDIVQEFFYQFWKNRESIRLRLSLSAYLYQSIRNNSLHYREHLSVRKQYAEEVLREASSGQPFEELSEMGVEEINALIESTLQQLPERCSRIFRMNRFEGMKYREIADKLAISVKTVEADMGKALQMFRQSFREYTNAAS